MSLKDKIIKEEPYIKNISIREDLFSERFNGGNFIKTNASICFEIDRGLSIESYAKIMKLIKAECKKEYEKKYETK